MGEVPNGQIATGVCYTYSDENTPPVTDGNGVSSTRWVAVRFINNSGEGIPEATGFVTEFATGYATRRPGVLNAIGKCSAAELAKIAEG